MTSTSAVEFLTRAADWVEPALDAAVAVPEGPLARLYESMRYSLLGGGKRLRPALCRAACEAVGGEAEAALAPAVALELIHTYSLIHDDLPCMDDDALRRGRPTNHIVYGEAAAVLAGDGLLTRAFRVLGEADLPADAIASLTAILARAAGADGMVGGQVLDLEAEGSEDVDLARLRYIHEHKTGALIAAACEMGGVAAGASAGEREALRGFGARVGLAFQIVDDVLDETSSAGELGKEAQKDRERGKATYPGLLGLDRSREWAKELIDEAVGSTEAWGPAADPLRALAQFVVVRSS